MNTIQPSEFGSSSTTNQTQLYEQMLAAQGNVVLHLSGDLVIIYASSSAEHLLGITPDEILNNRILDYVPQVHHEYIQDYVAGTLSVTSITFDWLTPTGRQPVELTSYGSIDDNFYCTLKAHATEFAASNLQLYKQAVEASQAAVIIADAQAPDMPVIYVNTRFQSITGYTSDDVIGKNCRFLHGEDRDQQGLEVVRQAIENGTDCKVVLRNYRKNGALFWNELSITPIRDQHNRITHYVGISTDITTQINAEEQLAEKHNLLRALIDNIPDHLYAQDRQGRYILVNDAYARHFELQSGRQMLGTKTHDWFPDDLADRFLEEDEHILESGEMLILEELYQRAGYPDRWYSVIKAPLRNDAGTIVGLIGILRNITQRKKQEIALRANEERTRMLLNAIPDMIFLMAADGTFTGFHASVTAHPLEPPDAFIGKRITDSILPQSVSQESIRLIRAATETGEIQNHEYMLELPDGEHYYQARIAALSENEVLSISRDITDLKITQQNLQKRIEELMILRQIDSEIAASLEVDHVLRMALIETVMLSGADAGFIGLADNDDLRIDHLVGDYPVDLHDKSIHKPSGNIQRVMQLQKSELIHDLQSKTDDPFVSKKTHTKIIIPLVSREQTIGVLNLEASNPHTFTDETVQILNLIAGRIGTALDNAHLHRQTESQLAELQALYDKVSNLEQLKTDMIRIASHDLRNPIAVILGYLGILLEDDQKNLTEEQTIYLRRMQTACKQIQQITSGILSLEQIEEREGKPFEKINICDVVKETAQNYEDQIIAKSLTHKIKVPDQKIAVEADPIQLQEAITNLIVNAIKYTPSGGHIDVNVTQKDTNVQFTVEDTGYGIPKEKQGRLFQPFYRIRTADTRDEEGSGLGLHLVKNIVDRHQGEIIFRSESGHGSTFGFKLPIVT